MKGVYIPITYQIIYDKKSLKDYLSVIDTSELIAIDTETTGLEIEAGLLGISIYDKTHEPVFIVCNEVVDKGIDLADLIDCFNPLFLNKEVLFIGHNAKYDLGVFKTKGFADFQLKYDSMMAIHIVDPELKKQLEYRVEHDLGVHKPKFDEVMGKKWDKIIWNDDAILKLAEYASGDALYTRKLNDMYIAMLEEAKTLHILTDIEVPICYVLRDMKLRGVRIDVDLLNKMSIKISSELKRLTSEIYEEAGCIFNINSSAQKAKILFEDMGYKPTKKSPGGKDSTDAHVLKELAKDGCSFAKKLLDYAELSKLKSTYVDGIPALCDKNNILHADFNSAGARTGRMSGSNPNLQNQPNNKNYPIRKAFIPREGYKFIVLDYSQIELRVMAHCSSDTELVRVFKEGLDVHGSVAEKLNISRKHAKIVNFGIMYGMGPDALGGFLEVPKDEARAIINGYHKAYTGYDNWKSSVEAFATRNGYVKNIFGRIRRLENATASGSRSREYFSALRQAVNTIVQGSAADLMKLALISMYKKFKARNMDAHVLMTVHDEFVIEAKENIVDSTFILAKSCMENVVDLKVPIIAEGKICDTWYDMKDDDFSTPKKRIDFNLMYFIDTWFKRY